MIAKRLKLFYKYILLHGTVGGYQSENWHQMHTFKFCQCQFAFVLKYEHGGLKSFIVIHQIL
jgi:hypothetical protein